jgi:FXSXX-COOH protein
MSEAKSSPKEDDARQPVLDLSERSLDHVLDSEDTALAAAMRRLLDTIDRPGEAYAAHGSTP